MLNKEIVSRNFVNHFIIGYFALYVIYRGHFIEIEIYTRIVLAVVASYLLFIPARAIILLKYRGAEDEEKTYRKIYPYYHFRIFLILGILTWFYVKNVGVSFARIFVFVVAFDLIVYFFYQKWYVPSILPPEEKKKKSK